jgi:hypothetical protein
MAFGIAQKEEMDSYGVKQKLVTNVNKLAPQDLEYLTSQMEMLIHKSSQEEETIDDKAVDKNFISFLIRLYY